MISFLARVVFGPSEIFSSSGVYDEVPCIVLVSFLIMPIGLMCAAGVSSLWPKGPRTRPASNHLDPRDPKRRSCMLPLRNKPYQSQCGSLPLSPGVCTVKMFCLSQLGLLILMEAFQSREEGGGGGGGGGGGMSRLEVEDGYPRLH